MKIDTNTQTVTFSLKEYEERIRVNTNKIEKLERKIYRLELKVRELEKREKIYLFILTAVIEQEEEGKQILSEMAEVSKKISSNKELLAEYNKMIAADYFPGENVDEEIKSRKRFIKK